MADKPQRSSDGVARATVTSALKLVEKLITLQAQEHDIARELRTVLGGGPSTADVTSSLIGRYSLLFKERTGSGYRAAPQDVIQLRGLVKDFGVEEVERRMGAYFYDASDDYARKARYPFGLFMTQFNRFAQILPSELQLEPDGPEFDCRHTPRCRDAAAHTLRKIQEQMRAGDVV